jgi:hypothetical protein
MLGDQVLSLLTMPKATHSYTPLLYLSETSPNGIQRPRTATAHTSEKLALVCEGAG